MTLNMSQKSTFIILIISINIVSVLLLHQPIGKEASTSNTKYFKYFNYRRTVKDEFEPLELEKYYDSYYGHAFRNWPNDENDDYDRYEKNIKTFCKKDYVPYTQFKVSYKIVLFGSIMNDFRECLYNCKNDVSMLKLYFGPNASNDNIQTFIESWNYKSVMNKCLEDLKSKVLEKLKDYTSEEDKAKYNLSSETGLGEKAKIAFMIVMRDDKRYEYTDKQFELMKTDFENITGHKVCFKSSSDVILECNKLFEGNTKDLYKKRTKQFYVLRGFEDFKRFSNQIKASLKFLEYIEGKLINNKEPHYDEYNAHPITIEDYQELRKPIPLLHEDSYELYLMRLKRLKCVPFDEETWSTDMNELKQDHENQNFIVYEL